MTMQIRPMRDGELEELVAEHQTLNPDRPIKQDTIDSIMNYVQKGWEPGSFVRAALENNLMLAMGYADSYNRATLFQITQYIYNDIPSNCHGSPEIVEEYLRNFKTSEN